MDKDKNSSALSEEAEHRRRYARAQGLLQKLNALPTEAERER